MTEPPDPRLFLTTLVQARGLATIAALADSRPTASLRQLADDLRVDAGAVGLSAEACARELAQLWRQEAEQEGAAAIERMARRLLVGELHAAIPKGWLASWTDTHDARAAGARLSTAVALWADYLGAHHRRAGARLLAAMIDEGQAGMLRSGWLPADADDVTLIELFARHWTEQP